MATKRLRQPPMTPVGIYSAFLSKYSVQAKPQTPEQIATGREIGAKIAAELAKAIDDMVLPGRHATKETKPGINDLILRAYLVSVDEGRGQYGQGYNTGIDGW